jgi:hypothetical protein
VIILIIEIEGFLNHQVLLTGKKYSKQQLKKMYLQAKKCTYESGNFVGVFCRLYKFEQTAYSENFMVDYVLDTDTGTVYSPSY